MDGFALAHWLTPGKPSVSSVVSHFENVVTNGLVIWLFGHLMNKQYLPLIIPEQLAELHSEQDVHSVSQLEIPPLCAIGRSCPLQFPSAGNLDQLLGRNLFLCKIKCSLQLEKLLYPKTHYSKHFKAQNTKQYLCLVNKINSSLTN